MSEFISNNPNILVTYETSIKFTEIDTIGKPEIKRMTYNLENITINDIFNICNLLFVCIPKQLQDFINTYFTSNFVISFTVDKIKLYFVNILPLKLDSIEISHTNIKYFTYEVQNDNGMLLNQYPQIWRSTYTNPLVRSDGQQYYRFFDEIKPIPAITMRLYRKLNSRLYTKICLNRFNIGGVPVWIQTSNSSFTLYLKVDKVPILWEFN